MSSVKEKIKLEIKNMKKIYPNGDGVENINIQVHEGEFVTMLGPSGCGKSTILRTLGGFLKIDGERSCWTTRRFRIFRRKSGPPPWCFKAITFGLI